MCDEKSVIVLCGGIGAEREVSLQSGQSIAEALRARGYSVEKVCIDSDEVPVLCDRSVVFPALHGGFGEDGRLQSELERRGIVYCGSGPAASALCMAKDRTKVLAAKLKIHVPESLSFDGGSAPLADDVISKLGPSLVVKPADQGSSVGLYFTEHRSALGVTLSQINKGNWLIERRIRGRELTVGILEGKPMAIVEIVSRSGVYDYAAKYTPGSTEYFCPAVLDESVASLVREQAALLYDQCECRDFARVDFLLEGETPYFLEINTLPGLTPTSLLPKSALATGLDFESLCERLTQPAFERLNQAGNPEEGSD